jgi:hypothetical protein
MVETNELAHRLWRSTAARGPSARTNGPFVQNRLGDCWIDLAENSLGGT